MLPSVRKRGQSSSLTRVLPWIIIVVSAMNVIMIGGKRRSFGIFISALHNSFNSTSMTELNWIGDSYAGLGFFLMPFATYVLVRWNHSYRTTMLAAGLVIVLSCSLSSLVPTPRYLFLTHTILHGIGSTFVLCTTALVVGEYFNKHHKFHVMATTLVSGGPYGVLLLGPVFSALVEKQGWRIAFRILSIPFVFCCFLGAVFFIPKVKRKKQTSEFNTSFKKKSHSFCSLDHLIQNKQIVFWLTDRLLHNVVMYGLMMNLTAFVVEKLNKSKENAFQLNILLGIGESFIFTIGALIGDRLRGYLVIVQISGALLSSTIVCAVFYNLSHFVALMALVTCLGLTLGIGNTALYAVSEEICLLNGSVSYPMSRMFGGIGMLVAPLFSGLAIDRCGYICYLGLQGYLLLIRTVLLIIVYLILCCKENPHEDNLYPDDMEIQKLINKLDSLEILETSQIDLSHIDDTA